MMYTKMTKSAMKIAYKAHKEQFDKGGIPYIFHPIVVAQQMVCEVSTVVALLHDVVEDSDWTFKMLSEHGVSKDALASLKLLTRVKSMSYDDYIGNIKSDDIARKVKIADIKHNMDLSRLNSISDKDLERLDKYTRALSVLEEGDSNE